MSDEEFELFVRTYPTMRAGADSMYIPKRATRTPLSSTTRARETKVERRPGWSGKDTQ